MKNKSRVQLTQEEFTEWSKRYFLSNRNERMGQAFVNDHRIEDPELFAEDDVKVARKMVQIRYVRS